MFPSPCINGVLHGVYIKIEVQNYLERSQPAPIRLTKFRSKRKKKTKHS